MTNCDPAPVAPVAGYCPVAIHPDEETKRWLAGIVPPDHVRFYFHDIAMQQKTIEQNCGR